MYVATIHCATYAATGIPHPARPRNEEFERHLLMFTNNEAAAIIDGFARADLGQLARIEGGDKFRNSHVTLRLASEAECTEEGKAAAMEAIRAAFCSAKTN